eukprot:1331360-Rhodomonas_salina.4
MSGRRGSRTGFRQSSMCLLNTACRRFLSCPRTPGCKSSWLSSRIEGRSCCVPGICSALRGCTTSSLPPPPSQHWPCATVQRSQTHAKGRPPLALTGTRRAAPARGSMIPAVWGNKRKTHSASVRESQEEDA